MTAIRHFEFEKSLYLYVIESIKFGCCDYFNSLIT